MKKLHDKHEDRLLFAGIIVIAANAGGAWTPIGDVTTTMLWIGGQVSTSGIMKSLFVPSLINLLVPLFFAALSCKGRLVEPPRANSDNSLMASTSFERNLMFFLGVGILMFVPVFKSLTHLPPFMGILFGLGFLWLVGELIHRKKAEEEKEHLTLANALKRIDMASVIFFVGILLAVATLEHTRLLSALARWLDHVVGRQDLIVLLLGLLSAIVDNVPLVAATMGMYSLSHYPIDHFLWKFIAYCAGTGGSILIIGSASGVAAMGLERISFFWYMRKVGLLALVGYFAGAMAYIFQHQLLA
jgi:Na+/H+ antiporter NhaD/arsenite permease-like protein